eukprot:TRINITY_DN1650_c0_g1_i1.p1 TRINITY_DN1650_c0_g1~~TRINITY_DN1650_c0_g1_i1.p1  ORF type:complete len:171 (-),score=32.87 TRINITY_DN1650_c0_g1_i1:65-577(-)
MKKLNESLLEVENHEAYVTNYRKFLERTVCHIFENEEDELSKEYHAFIFNDMILFCLRKKRLSFFPAKKIQENSLTAVREVALSAVRATPCEEEEVILPSLSWSTSSSSFLLPSSPAPTSNEPPPIIYGISILHTTPTSPEEEASFTFFFDSLSERDRWIAIIKKAQEIL